MPVPAVLPLLEIETSPPGEPKLSGDCEVAEVESSPLLNSNAFTWSRFPTIYTNSPLGPFQYDGEPHTPPLAVFGGNSCKIISISVRFSSVVEQFRFGFGVYRPRLSRLTT